ncbi:MAG: response regulator [Chloroflexota bacterium]
METWQRASTEPAGNYERDHPHRDDGQRIIDLAQMYLEQEGYIVSSATDGVTAYQQILGNPPGLVVLDLMLPGIALCDR